MKFHGKPVLSLKYRAAIEDEACLTNVWREWNHYNSNSIIIEKSLKDIKAAIAAAKGTLTPNGTLFFSKSSTYPRFKLSDSGFKRCIKINKANNVVLGELNGFEHGPYEFYEDENYVYEFTNPKNNYILCSNWAKKNEWNNDPVAYVKNHHLFYGTEFKPCYKGVFSEFNANDADDVLKILDGTYKNLIQDIDLDKAINTTFDTLTAEDLESICTMLDSPDRTTQGLGLKMLTGFNVQDTPLTLRTVLGTRLYLQNNTEWKTVGVQQVLTSIDWKGFGTFPFDMYHIITPGGKKNTATEYDQSLCKTIYTIEIKKYLEKTVEQIRKSGILDTFNLNITYEIQ